MALPINCIPSSCGEKLTRNFVVGCLFLSHSSARRAIFLGGKKNRVEGISVTEHYFLTRFSATLLLISRLRNDFIRKNTLLNASQSFVLLAFYSSS